LNKVFFACELYLYNFSLAEVTDKVDFYFKNHSNEGDKEDKMREGLNVRSLIFLEDRAIAIKLYLLISILAVSA
jgi:hypothetical protein